MTCIGIQIICLALQVTGQARQAIKHGLPAFSETILMT
jgi:hypothetical protein